MLGALVLCAAAAASPSEARTASVAVEAWTTQTTARTVIGPVDDVRVRYNALHYTQVATTVAVVKKDPPDFGSVLAGVDGMILSRTQSTFGAMNGVVSITTSGPPPSNDCGRPGPTATSKFAAFMDDAVADARCFAIGADQFAVAAKALRDEIDTYQKAATEADRFLAGGSPDQTDDRITTLTLCANAFGAALAAALAVPSPQPGKPAPVGACTAANLSPAVDPSYPPLIAANATLAGLAAHLVNSVRAADEAFGAGRLSKEQREIVVGRLNAIPVLPYMPGGDQASAYEANRKTLSDAGDRLSQIKADAFTYHDRSSGRCSGSADGEKRTVTVTLYDRFAKPDVAPTKKDLVVIDCLSPNGVSAGAGYTGLRATTYALQQTFSGGTTTSTIAKSDDAGQLAASALVHRCICRYPTGTVDGFVTAGVITSGKSPLGLFGGLSARFSQRYLLNVGWSYGTETTLLNGTPGQAVPNDFKVSTGKTWRTRPAVFLTIGK